MSEEPPFSHGPPVSLCFVNSSPSGGSPERPAGSVSHDRDPTADKWLSCSQSVCDVDGEEQYRFEHGRE